MIDVLFVYALLNFRNRRVSIFPTGFCPRQALVYYPFFSDAPVGRNRTGWTYSCRCSAVACMHTRTGTRV